MLVGQILPAKEYLWCKSLIPLGGRVGLGVQGRPYFAAWGQMARLLEQLAPHWVTVWQHRLQQPLHSPSPLDFLSGFYLQTAGGEAPLRPY